MTGDFLITKEFLKELYPCTDGYRWFCKTYPDGGKYQEILDRLCELDRFCDARWLLDKVGATDDVLEIDSIDDKEKSICFAGTIIASKNLTLKKIKAGGYIEAGGHIKAGGYIEAGEHIKAGGHIKAGEYIEAGGYIEAGWHIKADWHIKAGKDYGVYAGIGVILSDMKKKRICQSSRKTRKSYVWILGG